MTDFTASDRDLIYSVKEAAGEMFDRLNDRSNDAEDAQDHDVCTGYRARRSQWHSVIRFCESELQLLEGRR